MSEATGQEKTEKRRDEKKTPAPPPPAKGKGGAAKPAAKAEAKPAAERRGAGGGTTFLALLAFLLAAAAGGGAYYLWLELQKSVSRLDQAESGLRQEIASARTSTEQALQRRTAELAEATEQRERRLRAELEALQRALGEVRARLGQDRAGWTTAEVEHLLRIANQRLALARDAEAAVAALEAADRRLLALGDPAFLPVREAIAREVQQLRGLGDSDRAGAALKLTGLIDAVAELPIGGPYRAEERAAPGPEGGLTLPQNVSDWKEFFSRLWADIRSLVVIRKREGAATPGPLLAPEERFFLRQNLRLELETARLALLQRDPRLYRQSLTVARDWVAEHFSERAPATRAALAALEELQGVEVDPELPDISRSLRLLDSVRQRLASERASAVPAEDGEGAQPEAAQ